MWGTLQDKQAYFCPDLPLPIKDSKGPIVECLQTISCLIFLWRAMFRLILSSPIHSEGLRRRDSKLRTYLIFAIIGCPKSHQKSLKDVIATPGWGVSQPEHLSEHRKKSLDLLLFTFDKKKLSRAFAKSSDLARKVAKLAKLVYWGGPSMFLYTEITFDHTRFVIWAVKDLMLCWGIG